MPYLKTVMIAIIGGIIMSKIHAPLPWTLGPIAAVSIAGLVQKHPLRWSLRIRNIALILLGYAMGRPFTAATLQAIVAQLPLMLMATMITVSAGIFTGWLMYRKTGINFTSCLLGCVPGGLSQMVILAAEIEDADLTAGAIVQTRRMLAVVFTIPFLTIHVLSDNAASGTGAAASMLSAASTEQIISYAVVAIAGAMIGRFIHLPTATLLGPILSTAAYIILSGTPAPAVPIHILNIAQLCVGSYIGSSIDLQKITSYHGMGPVLFSGILLVLLVSMGTGTVIALLTGESFATSFLSTAPGGLAEMGITALVVGANISTMTAYQLVRLLFIMMAFPYIAKGIVYIHRRHTSV